MSTILNKEKVLRRDPCIGCMLDTSCYGTCSKRRKYEKEVVNIKDYGTNNTLAYKEECPKGGKHEWVETKNLGRCYNQYECKKCGSIHKIDSSD
jgi:hypothetical protein